MSSPLIERLTREFGYPVLTSKTLDAFLQSTENTVLFFTEDPKTNPEANDVAVVLPELVRHFCGKLSPAIVAREDERTLQTLYGFNLWPALVFLRKDKYLGVISKIRDWSDYLDQIQGFLDAGPVRPPTLGIPIISA